MNRKLSLVPVTPDPTILDEGQVALCHSLTRPFVTPSSLFIQRRLVPFNGSFRFPGLGIPLPKPCELICQDGAQGVAPGEEALLLPAVSVWSDTGFGAELEWLCADVCRILKPSHDRTAFWRRQRQIMELHGIAYGGASVVLV